MQTSQMQQALLGDWKADKPEALDRLVQGLYQSELLPRARNLMINERFSHLIEPEDLVNRAWERARRQKERSFEDLSAFFGWWYNQMNLSLIDLVREQTAARRGGQTTGSEVSIQQCETWLSE